MANVANDMYKDLMDRLAGRRLTMEELARMRGLARDRMLDRMTRLSEENRENEDKEDVRAVALSDEGQRAFGAMQSGGTASAAGRQEVVDASLYATRSRDGQVASESGPKTPLAIVEKAPVEASDQAKASAQTRNQKSAQTAIQMPAQKTNGQKAGKDSTALWKSRNDDMAKLGRAVRVVIAGARKRGVSEEVIHEKLSRLGYAPGTDSRLVPSVHLLSGGGIGDLPHVGIPGKTAGTQLRRNDHVSGMRLCAAISSDPIHDGTHGPGVYDITEADAVRAYGSMEAAAYALQCRGYVAAVRYKGQPKIYSNHIHFADPRVARASEISRLRGQRW